MKSNLILLLSEDVDLEEQLCEAARSTGAGLISAQDVGAAIQVVCARGREIDLAVIDFEDGCHRVTLLSALTILRDDLPIVVVTSSHSGHAAALAYANGAAACLSKPVKVKEFEIVIRGLGEMNLQLEAA